MRLLVVTCFVAIASASVVRHTNSENLVAKSNPNIYAESEDANLNFIELATKYKYPVEDHYVTTDDGYILNIHRIPYGKNGPPSKQRGVAFVQHGILCSSVDWIIPGPEEGLAYMLADQGYDVWLGNFRGNTQSKNHTSFATDSKQFWDFSWHEMGIYDLPAMIDYVLEYTKEEKLFYIGHSQGTTAFYVMASERPEYNDKIRAQFSLAPIAYVGHMASPMFQILAKFEGSMEIIFDLIGMYEFLPNEGFLHEVTKVFCEDGITQVLCTNALFAACGFNKEQFNETLLPIMMGHTPAGASTKQFIHFAQLINTGGILSSVKFRKFDYGLFGNMDAYGQSSPPNYKLGNIRAPVYLFYSHNDWLSAESDVNKLYGELPNVQGKFLNPDSKFNHLDYMFGIDADILVYKKVFSLMLHH